MRWVRVSALYAVSLAFCAAQAPTFTGVWRLNVSRSTWGMKQPPVSVIIDVDHREPSLRYTGTVINVQGEERLFEFAGATDGKEYASTRPAGEGKVVLTRLTPFVILVTFRTNDGAVVERTRMTLSRDGRTLTYQVRVSDSGREVGWTEVYEKK